MPKASAQVLFRIPNAPRSDQQYVPICAICCWPSTERVAAGGRTGVAQPVSITNRISTPNLKRFICDIVPLNIMLITLLSSHEVKALEAFLDRVFGEYPTRIDQVVLFGSKARGDHHTESDLDILLVADTDDWRFKHAISTVAADIGLEYDVLIDARVIGRERWERMKQEGFSLYENISQEGVPLTPAPA